MSIALLGVADYLTTLSLAVFYVIPITIATMAIGAGPSYLLAIEGALVFALSQGTHSGSPPLWVPIANGVFWVLAYGLVVFFVSALRGFAAAAQASEQRSRDFLATASHQLRTPVSGILVSAEALTVEADEQVRRRLAANLAAEATRLGRLVANLLRTTRLEQSQTMDLRSVDLAALCEDQVDVFRERVPGLHIAVSAGANVQPALADPQLIDEALVNLLDNACRHARSQVAVTVESGEDVVITVRDDGPGLPAGSEQRVFERFVSLDSAGGAGLGLPIARALCRAPGRRRRVERSRVRDSPAGVRVLRSSRRQRGRGARPTIVYAEPVPPRALATIVTSSTVQRACNSMIGRCLSTDRPAPRRARARVR